MSDEELFSVVVRLLVLILLGSTLALLAWWEMKGPALGVAASAAGVLMSTVVDIARHAK